MAIFSLAGTAVRRAVPQSARALSGDERNQPVLTLWARGPGKVLAEEKDLLQRSAFLDVQGGATALRAVHERQDGDSPPDGFGE